MNNKTWQQVLTEIWEQNRSNSETVFTLPEAIAELKKVINTEQNKQIIDAYHDKEENRKIGANMERETILELLEKEYNKAKNPEFKGGIAHCINILNG